MRIKSDGKVGIGTNNPQQLLHIDGTNPVIRLRDSDATGTPLAHIDASGGALKLQADSSNETADSFLTLEVDGSEHVRVKSDGNVGIGTNAPGTILHLKKNDAVGPTISLTNNSKTSYINLWGATGGGADRTNQFEINAVNTGYGLTLASTDYVRFKTNVITASDEAMRINSNGRVGIGTTSPDSNLDIEGTGSPELRVTDTTNTVGAYIQSNDTKTIFGSRTNHPVQIEQNAGAALYIDTSKNVWKIQ